MGYSAACERNQGPILEQLSIHLAGRRRVLAEHTSWQRATALEAWVAQASPGGRAPKHGKVPGEAA